MAAGSAQARTPTFDVTLAQILAMEPIQKTMSWARTFASYILINNFWIEMERRISPPRDQLVGIDFLYPGNRLNIAAFMNLKWTISVASSSSRRCPLQISAVNRSWW
jgi:hypothetical protein